MLGTGIRQKVTVESNNQEERAPKAVYHCRVSVKIELVVGLIVSDMKGAFYTYDWRSL